MLEAPNPNPKIILGSLKIRYNPKTPRSPSPVTHIPITVPLEKAIINPSFKLRLQALAVLAFADVATRIPIFPATAENIAPTTKVRAICQLIK